MNRPVSGVSMRLRALLATLAFATFAPPAGAVDWTGGDPLDFFHLGPNWNGGVAPVDFGGGETNFALPGAYDVLWNSDTGNVLNDGKLNVSDGDVTFAGTDGVYTYRMAGQVGVGAGGVSAADIRVGATLTLDRIALEITGRLEVAPFIAGQSQALVGTLNVIGADSSVTAETLCVGCFLASNGALNVEAGGTVAVTGVGLTESFSLSIGGDSFNNSAGLVTGAATVTGAGSSLTTAGRLMVGDGGSGVLSVLNGGAVNSAGAAIAIIRGSYDNPVSTVTVSGTGSTWTNSGDLEVGKGEFGTLLIEDGGTVTNAAGVIATSPGGSGPNATGSSVTVTGAGSSWVNSGNLTVGEVWSAILEVADGATVTSAAGFIGPTSAGSAGVATVTGAFSTWTNTNGLYVGGTDLAARWPGTLNVLSGGTADAGALLKIWGPGTVNLDGGTISAAALQRFGVFNFVSGTFRFVGDALLDTAALTDLDIADPLPTLVAGRSLEVAGAATLTTALRLNGGELAVGSIDAASAAFLDLDAGTFSLTASDLVVDGSAGAQFGADATFGTQNTVRVSNGALAVGADGAFHTFGDFSAVSLNNNGSASHFGGNTVLSGAVTNNAGAQLAVFNTGPGSVDYGADSATAVLGAPGVKVDNHGDLVLSDVELVADLEGFAGSTLTVLGNVHVWGTFSGVADVFGPGTLNPEIFSPGASAELMNVEGNLTLGPLTIMELGGTTPGTGHDQTHVQQTLTLGGTLDIQLIDDLTPGYAPAAGDLFVLFTSDLPILGSFEELLLPVLAPNLQWLTTQTATSYALGVAVVPLPGSVLLIAPALVLLGALRRRTA